MGTKEIEHFLGNDSCDELSASHMSEIPHLVRASEAHNTGLDVSRATSAVVNLQSSTTRSGSMCKGKLEIETRKKEAPNCFSFPPNVRSLMSTGIFDGVLVKYISSSGEELHGIVKDSGYLCGYQTCNVSKVLSAYEFEHHAGCKTKHPNNHIYFDSGKTLYGIVQELRGTPENLLFEKIQTVNGSAINQKSFCLWKESFQAASRELERIYEFANLQGVGKNESRRVNSFVSMGLMPYFAYYHLLF